MSADEAAWTSWRFLAWLQAWPLNRSTALDYFKQSSFYDPSCNNELISLQRTVDHSHLKTMTGIEYEVDHSSAAASTTPSYILIKKQERHSPTSVTVVAVYYIVGTGPQWGTVYQMPSVYSVLACNLATSAYYLSEAFSLISSHVEYNPLTDYRYDWQSSSQPESTPAISQLSSVVDIAIRKQYEIEPTKKQ